VGGINTYFICWAAREAGLRVALSGLGGDELFAGDSIFPDTLRLVRLTRLARMVPAALRRTLVPLLHTFFVRTTTRDAAGRAAAAWSSPNVLPHPYFLTRSLFPLTDLSRLTEPRIRPVAVNADGITLEPTWLGWLERAVDAARKLDPVASITWVEMRSYMASTLLRNADSVSMAHSLEMRVPLLDTPLVEFVNSLPDAARIHHREKKALLIAAVRDLLPQGILAQRKRTLTLPWEEWLRGPLRARVEASLADLAPGLATHVHAKGARDVWTAFLSGETSWSHPWSLYVLNEWCRRHLTA
jgi:asparagine synthase (glutamine-hydrolysing)